MQSGDQMEPLEVSDGTYMDRLYSKNTETSLKGVIREEHNHIYCFKIQSRRAFPSPLPHPHLHERLFSLHQGHGPSELQLSAFLSGATETPIYLFSATEREQGIQHSSNTQEATLGLIFLTISAQHCNKVQSLLYSGLVVLKL